MKLEKKNLLLYAVTDPVRKGKKSLEEQVEEALRGGVTMLQFRDKEAPSEEFCEKASRLLSLCRRYGVPLIVNDRVTEALRIGADGVHVGQEDAAVREIRRLAGEDFIIGATAKTVAQAREAERQGADYLGVGAVFPSPTKKNAIRITPELLGDICRSVSIPAVAIGGINLSNLPALRGGGMAGIAVVSALFAREDVKTAAEELKRGILSLLDEERTDGKY